jgi:predicted transcriptional regulator
MSTLVIGIASFDQIKARTVAIAKGEYKSAKGEPKVWFRSIELFAQVLSSRNKILLEIIKTRHPKSITELAELAGREVSNTSRTLKNMKKYGLVELVKGEHRSMRPILPYDNLKIKYDFL